MSSAVISCALRIESKENRLARTVSFEHSLTTGVMARVRLVKERGRVLSFTVQLECLIADAWHPIVRYDTAHGFVHQDILKPDGATIKRVVPVQDLNAALTFAHEDIRDCWFDYLERYKRWYHDGQQDV